MKLIWKVLHEIARKSKGGTFSFVDDGQSISEPLSQIVGGLLSIVVQDLKLTVSPLPGDSAIEKVNAGLHLQTRDANTGSVTVSFGDLFATEVRRIIVDVLLPTVRKGKKVTAIIAYCTYRYFFFLNGEQSPSLYINTAFSFIAKYESLD
jgi:hypothetical protein